MSIGLPFEMPGGMPPEVSDEVLDFTRQIPEGIRAEHPLARTAGLAEAAYREIRSISEHQVVIFKDDGGIDIVESSNLQSSENQVDGR